MDLFSILQAKPVLIGLHLGFAILGIDLFLWLLGKVKDNSGTKKSNSLIALGGVLAFGLSWIAGGYYYVIHYGSLVKPIIKAGLAPWAHNIIMETKEHIFLFIIPLAITAFLITLLEPQEINQKGLRKSLMWLCGTIAILGLIIGAMGFIISAAARWGALLQ